MFLSVVWASRISWGRPYPAVFFLDQLLVGQFFFDSIAPIKPRLFVKQLGARPVARDRWDMSEEIFDVVDENDVVVGQAPRCRPRNGGLSACAAIP